MPHLVMAGISATAALTAYAVEMNSRRLMVLALAGAAVDLVAGLVLL
jgi:hypothetical protein